MSKISKKPLSFWVPLFAVSLLATAFVMIEWFAILPGVRSAANGVLSQVQISALETFKELTRLFITWSLAVIGATAFFLKAAIDGDHKLTRSSLLSAEGVILCAIVSIFFGHLALNALLNMLALDIFDIRDKAVMTYGLLQYLSFLLAILAFFVFIHVTYWSSIHGNEGGSE